MPTTPNHLVRFTDPDGRVRYLASNEITEAIVTQDPNQPIKCRDSYGDLLMNPVDDTKVLTIRVKDLSAGTLEQTGLPFPAN